MTQESRPVGQHVNNFPDGDSGPYSSAEWREIFAALFTSDPTAQGPIATYDNELAVTESAGDVLVDTGAAIVNGNIHLNDASVTFSPPATGAGTTRYDRVAVVLNDTASLFGPNSDAGYTLLMPNDVTDYEDATHVQEYACRLVIVEGTEGGGLPTLDQNASHWMVPLAYYQINDAGTISGLTDEREAALFNERPVEKLVSPSIGYNFDTDDDIFPDTFFDPDFKTTTLKLRYADDCGAYGTFIVPENVGPVVQITPLLIPGATGEIYVNNGEITWGDCTEYGGTHSAQSGYSTVSVAGLQHECILNLIVGNMKPGDIVHLEFRRDATTGADTLLGLVHFVGWIISYVPS